MGNLGKSKYLKESFIGKKYNSLTVIGLAGMNGNVAIWKVKCDCGKEKNVEARYVMNGHTKSCGCYWREVIHFPRTHGLSGTRLYTIWRDMLNRCKKGNVSAKYHGDRGITVCDEWHNYKTFYDWAISHGYEDEKNLSIERIDVNGDYCEENCEWIPRNLQARNRRITLWAEYNGKRMTLKEASVAAGLPYKQVYSRIRYLGWPIEKALSIPMNETRKWKRSDRFCKQI